MDLRARIQKAIAERPDLTVRSLSLKAGLSDSALHKFLSGQTASLTVDNLEKLSRVLQLSASELLGGEMLSNRSPLIRVTAMPADTNPYGGVFGGWLMSQMALGAGSLASRVGHGKAVVVSASDFAFPGAMEVGDELSVYCAIAATGTTSLTITAEAVARERNGEAENRVAQGTFKFVLLDENDRPRAVERKWV